MKVSKLVLQTIYFSAFQVWDLRTFEKRTVLAKHTDCVSCLYIGPEYMYVIDYCTI